jgi:vacuolar-type H+-ATPase subunit I/STV1
MGKSFKEFDVCKSFKHKSKEKLLKYLDELYDQKSSFNSVSSLIERKKLICQKVGLDPEEVKDILENKNEQFCQVIFHYQSFYKNNNAHQQLLNDQNLFWGIQLLLSNPMAIDLDEDQLSEKFKKRADLSRLSNDVQKRINETLSVMYKDDEAMKEIAGSTIRQTIRMEDWLKDLQDVQADK